MKSHSNWPSINKGDTGASSEPVSDANGIIRATWNRGADCDSGVCRSGDAASNSASVYVDFETRVRFCLFVVLAGCGVQVKKGSHHLVHVVGTNRARNG